MTTRQPSVEPGNLACIGGRWQFIVAAAHAARRGGTVVFILTGDEAAESYVFAYETPERVKP